ncbi:MAG: BON domain-containing protein [Parachlamydiaceae bacterium]
MKMFLTLLVFGSTSLLFAEQPSNGGSTPQIMTNPSRTPQANAIPKMPSDQDIMKKINDVITTSGFSKGYQKVTAEVNNGVVTLRGTVDSVDNRNKIGYTIRDINGVRKVHNHIVTLEAFRMSNK